MTFIQYKKQTWRPVNRFPQVCFLCVAQTELLTLVSVLSQSFFTLVRRHFMSFLFLSVWHSFTIYRLILKLFLYLVYESLCRLERWNVVFGDSDCLLLVNVTCSLLRSMLDDEATESAQIYRLLIRQ